MSTFQTTSKDTLTDFWSNRYSTLGHTGWIDPLIYAYDQTERIALISEQLNSLAPEPLTALDFGCGTGDFSKLLLAQGYKVFGYDPYVEPKISHPGFKHSSDITVIETQIDDNELGVILCVTVLDHILDDEKFQDRLTFFRTRVSKRGFLLMMEYAVDEPSHHANDYQAFRTLDIWQQNLIKAGWQEVSVQPVPHPMSAPSIGFLGYRKSSPVRIISRLLSHSGLTAKLLPILRKYADFHFTRNGIGNVGQSPLKLLLYRPI